MIFFSCVGSASVFRGRPSFQLAIRTLSVFWNKWARLHVVKNHVSLKITICFDFFCFIALFFFLYRFFAPSFPLNSSPFSLPFSTQFVWINCCCYRNNVQFVPLVPQYDRLSDSQRSKDVHRLFFVLRHWEYILWLFTGILTSEKLDMTHEKEVCMMLLAEV